MSTYKMKTKYELFDKELIKSQINASNFALGRILEFNKADICFKTELDLRYNTKLQCEYTITVLQESKKTEKNRINRLTLEAYISNLRAFYEFLDE